jgi:hypothetical protein
MATVAPATPDLSTVPVTASRARAAIVSAALTVGAATVAAVVLLQPWGGRNELAYGDIAPHRDAAWLGAVADGLGIAVVAIGLALAVCMLAPTRGSTLANIGAVVAGIGGAAFCAGQTAFGSIAWYATDTHVLSTDAGTSLLKYVVDNPGHGMAEAMAGFLLYSIGSLLLMGALWRARSVPRWLPVAYLVLTIGVFLSFGVVANIVQAAQTLSLVVVAYSLVRSAGRRPEVTTP